MIDIIKCKFSTEIDSEFREKFLRSDTFAVEVFQEFAGQPAVIRALVAALQGLIDPACKNKTNELSKAFECLERMYVTGKSPHENTSLTYKFQVCPIRGGKRRRMIISNKEMEDEGYPLVASQLGDPK